MKFIFDLDGVLIKSRLPNKSFIWQLTLEKDLGISPNLLTQIFSFPHWHEVLINKKNVTDRIVEIFNKNKFTLEPEVFLNYWLQNDLNWNQEVIDIANKLKSNGHSLEIATNQEKLRRNFIENQLTYKNIFSKISASSDLGFAKPDINFFEKLNKTIPKHEKVIFIDDDIKNIETAAQIGWRSFHFNPDLDATHKVDTLEKFLKEWI